MPYEAISPYRFVITKQRGESVEWAVIAFGLGQSVPVDLKSCSVGTNLALAQATSAWLWLHTDVVPPLPAVALPSESAAGRRHGNTREHMGLGRTLLQALHFFSQNAASDLDPGPQSLTRIDVREIFLSK